MPSSEDVLRFWFPPGPVDARRMEWWFRGGANAETERRFAPLLERASRGEHDDWCRGPRSRLALIIVLDQFSRAIHAGTGAAFANDPKALAIAREGIEIGHYAALESPWQKTFFFLPLGHSENLAAQSDSVRLADALAAEASLEDRKLLEHSARQARGHHDVIARFGRHPHRNAVLGRESTPEELDYLTAGEFVHTREVPR